MYPFLPPPSFPALADGLDYVITVHMDQCAGACSRCSGASLIISSIRRMVMAASVANLRELILEIMGSSTPAVRLLRHFPFNRSSPQYFRFRRAGSVSSGFCEAAWRVRNLEISSVASLAALTARVLGMTLSASLNSAMAICSLVSKERAYCSRWMLTAISTAPPPGTTLPDSRVLLATQMESWRDLNREGVTFRPHPTCTRWLHGGQWCRRCCSCSLRRRRSRYRRLLVRQRNRTRPSF